MQYQKTVETVQVGDANGSMVVKAIESIGAEYRVTYAFNGTSDTWSTVLPRGTLLTFDMYL